MEKWANALRFRTPERTDQSRSTKILARVQSEERNRNFGLCALSENDILKNNAKLKDIFGHCLEYFTMFLFCKMCVKIFVKMKC